jgi:hypothetical protein
MGIKRIFGLAGLLAACGMIGGCCGDGCRNCTGSKTTRPAANQDPSARVSNPSRPAGWANQPQAQSAGQAGTSSTGLIGSGTPAQQPPSDSMPAARTSNSGIVPAGGMQTDAGVTTLPTPVRTVTPPKPGEDPGAKNQPMIITPPVVNTNDLPPQSSAGPASQGNGSRLPAPPPDVPPLSNSTSKYPSAPMAPLPPETIPGQSAIPALPPSNPKPAQ